MNKPRFLYHGSCQAIERVLTPHLQHADANGNFPEGKRNLVFATHDSRLAAIYALKNKYHVSTTSSDDLKIGFFRDYDSWLKSISSASCNVYAFASDTFTNPLNNAGLPSVEWQSSLAVTPNHVLPQTPATVMQTGAQLFFLDAKIENKFWHADPKKAVGATFLNRIAAKKQAGILPEAFTTMNLARELIDAGVMRHLNADEKIKPITPEKSPYGKVIEEDIDWLKQQIIEKAAPQRADRKLWTAALGMRTGRTLAT